MLLNLGNLGGILYYDNIPFLQFKYLNNELIAMELLSLDDVVLPVEFDSGFFTDKRLRRFFYRRMLASSVEIMGSVENYLKETKATCLTDEYWLREIS